MPTLVSAVDLLLYLSVVFGVAIELGYFYRGRHRGEYRYWPPKIAVYNHALLCGDKSGSP